MAKKDTHMMRALEGLEHGSATVRLRAALAAGTAPDPRFVDKLIERCAIEPEFPVRDMLTWALTRHAPSTTVPGLIGELRSECAQARSQALHTLSKIGDRRAWPAITHALLTDSDDEVARSAWRAAAGGGRSRWSCRASGSAARLRNRRRRQRSRVCHLRENRYGP